MRDAYYDAYTSPEPVDAFLRDVNVKASNPIFRKLLRPSGIEPQDVRDMAAFFASMQKGRSGAKGGGISSFFGHPQTDTLPAQCHRLVIEGASTGRDKKSNKTKPNPTLNHRIR